MRLLKWSMLAVGGLFAGGVLLLTALGSGSASAASGTGQPSAYETALAQKLGISVDQLRTAQKAALDSAIDQAAATGNLTADQAAKLKSGDFKTERKNLRQARGGRHILGRVVDSAAKVINLPVDQVKAGLKSGQSLTQIAVSRGISRDQLKAGMTADIQAQIKVAVASNKLTQVQADKINANLSARLDKVIDRVPPKR